MMDLIVNDPTACSARGRFFAPCYTVLFLTPLWPSQSAWGGSTWLHGKRDHTSLWPSVLKCFQQGCLSESSTYSLKYVTIYWCLPQKTLGTHGPLCHRKELSPEDEFSQVILSFPTQLAFISQNLSRYHLLFLISNCLLFARLSSA